MIQTDLILSAAHEQALARLRGITGFVTTLTRDGDERASVFNRLAHVERVLHVSRALCRILRADSAASDRVVLLHDLNRWAFAHNAERGVYAQEAELGAYLRRVIPEITEDEVRELRSFHRKELSGMRPAARPALAADMLTGIVEDTILLISALNVHPKAVSGALYDALFSDLPDRGDARLRELCVLLNADRDIPAFSDAFHAFFSDRVNRVIRRYAADAPDAMLERIVRDYLQIWRRDKNQMFRINNELICHGSCIRSLIRRMIERRGYPAVNELLLTLDEPGFAARLREEGFDARELELLYPDLDYTSRPDSDVACLLRLR